MRKTLGLFAALGAIVLGVAGTAPAASAEETTDWISVTKVMVNRLGGVNVSGEVSCAGTYQRLVDGQLMYQDEQGEWVPIPFDEGDLVILSANSDDYTVTQPLSRKSVIQVKHESSRMNPCFVTAPTQPDGSPLPASLSCDASGAPCTWETDAYGYDRELLGPLYDYSTSGKFKTGLLSVTAQSIGLLVQILNEDGTWEFYFIEEGSYSMTSGTIKAVSAR